MATFEATRKLDIDGIYRSTESGVLATAQATIGIPKHQAYTNGTGANQANAWYAKTRSLSSSTPETIDLDADLADQYGTTLVFTKIKEIWVINRSSTTVQDLTLTGDVMLAFVGNATHQAKAAAGGMWHQSSPIDGFTISSVGQDELTVTPGAYAINYDLIIIGVV